MWHDSMAADERHTVPSASTKLRSIACVRFNLHPSLSGFQMQFVGNQAIYESWRQMILVFENHDLFRTGDKP
jgi:hypothetical protein